jgi:hypothetical protein
MMPEEPAGGGAPAGAPPEEWVEVYRGARRRVQVIIRTLVDASLSPRDARRLGIVPARAQEGIVQVPASQTEAAKRIVESLKKNFPHLFAVGPTKGD